MTSAPSGKATGAPGFPTPLEPAPCEPSPERSVAMVGVRFRDSEDGKAITMYAVKALGLIVTETQDPGNKSHKTADWQSLPVADVAVAARETASFYELNGYVLTVAPVMFALEPLDSVALVQHAEGSGLSTMNRQRIGVAFDRARVQNRTP